MYATEALLLSFSCFSKKNNNYIFLWNKWKFTKCIFSILFCILCLLLDYQVPVTQLKGRRYASRKLRLKCATYPRSQYMIMWAVDRFKRYGR